MKSPYVSDLQPNQIITATLLVHLKDIRQKKTGEQYLSLVLGDRTGELDAKMWDNVPDVIDTFERDDFIKVKGMLQVYQNRPQLTIHKMIKIRDAEVDFSDYLPASQRDPREMFAELQAIVAGVQNPHLRSLLEAFLDDQPLMARYRIAPAAKSVHHAFLSGLLEHVLSLCSLCKTTAAQYPFVDLDLMLTGAILHDIGKVAELTYDRSFGYSHEGQLLGHIVIGLRMLHQKVAQLASFPARLCTLVEHLIISHHGELEFGSPKTPLFPEAMLLHHLDNLDSKMECMRAMIAKDRLVDGCWTAYNPTLSRSVLKKIKFLELETDTEAPAAVLDSASESKPAVSADPPLVPPVAPPRSETARQPHPQASARERQVSVFGEKLQQAWQK